MPSPKKIVTVSLITAAMLAAIYRVDDLRDIVLDDGSWWPF